jgi:hypothetical protein
MASASAPLRVAEHLMTAPDGPVRVLHHTPAALYVDVAGRCVGVVGPSAAQVPCALRLPGVSAAQVLAAVPANPYVERGTLHLFGNPLRIGRLVDVRVPRVGLGRVLRAASPTDEVAGLPRTATEGLAALQPLPPRPAPAVLRRLVGSGGGLTPLGDDVLCGWLAVLVATGRLGDEVAADVRAVLDRTTLLSATLLDCALHGEVLPEFATYLASVGTPAEPAATQALTRIGHTSGAGLWWGARHALTTLALEEAA